MKKILLSIVALVVLSAGASAQTVFSYTGAFQTYTVPAGVTSISIEALGAQGASGDIDYVGGQGASVYGEFTVAAGDNIIILVGGMGGGQGAGSNGGGGGASWVVLENPSGAYTFTGGTYAGTSFDLLAVAGGGSGTRDAVDQNGNPGVAEETGTTGSGSATTGGGTVSATAIGDGGAAAPASWGSGGGGLNTNGGNDGTYGFGGNSFLSGGAIATGGTAAGDDGTGGFGGGGQGRGYYGGGGGGGYTGGDGGRVGGGGGSFNAGTAQVNVTGANAGDGQVTITDLCLGLTYTVSGDTLCEGDSLVLHAASSGSGVITWDGGVTDSVAFLPPLGETTYTATSSDPGDCAFSTTVFVGALPTVDAGADVNFCPGDSVVLNAAGTATDWSWDGGITDGLNFLPPSGTTTYTLTGTIDSTGCQAVDMVDVIEVIIDNSISVIGSDLVANQAGAAYQWLDCPGLTPISGETDQSFTPGADGDYAVEITLDGCVDTTSCQVVHVGVADLQNGNKPNVYPNPTTENVTIFAKGRFTYQLVSAKGDIISIGEGKDSEEVDMNNLPAGTYMINVMTEFGVQPVKVVKK